MKVKIHKDTLIDIMERGIKFIDENNPIPICSHFLVQCASETLFIRATDVKGEFIGATELKSEDFIFCVPAKIFYATIKDFRDNKVEITITPTHINIGSGKSKYKLSVVDPSEFPIAKQIDVKNEVSINATHLKEMVKNAHPFIITNDMAKLQFSGVYMTVDEGKFIVMATDSHQFIKAQTDIQACTTFAPSLLDDDTIKKVVGLIKDEMSVDITSSNDNNIRFRIKSKDYTFIYTSAILEYVSKFPYAVSKKFFQNLPKDEISFVTVELRETVKRVERYTGVVGQVVLTHHGKGNTTDIYAENLEYGNSGVEEITGADGEKEIKTGFNAQKLLSILHQIEEENTSMFFTLPNKPFFIIPLYRSQVDISYSYMIMPSVMLEKAKA